MKTAAVSSLVAPLAVNLPLQENSSRTIHPLPPYDFTRTPSPSIIGHYGFWAASLPSILRFYLFVKADKMTLRRGVRSPRQTYRLPGYPRYRGL